MENKSSFKRVLGQSSLLIFLACFGTASGQANLDELAKKLMVEPANTTVREQIIKLANETKPSPAIPETARRSFVQGNVIFKDAKDAAGQQLAIAAFKDAVKAAPWWSEAYYNLAVAQELIGSFADARDSLSWYIKTKPGEKEERAAQDKIYALEAKEKLSQATAAKEQARVAQLKAEADAKVAREAQAANAINAYRGNYNALRCGVRNEIYSGCNGSEFPGANWYWVKDYENRATYRFTFTGDGTVEIGAPVGTNWTTMGTWGVYGIVKKVVGRWSDSEYKIVWTCHYTDDNRTNIAHVGTNAADFVLACDEGPTREQDPNRRYRYIEFRRL